MPISFPLICIYAIISIAVATNLKDFLIYMTKSVHKLSSLTPNIIQMLSVFAIVLCMSILFPYLTYSPFDTKEQYSHLIMSTVVLSSLLYFLYWLHTKSSFRSLSIEKVMLLEDTEFVRYLCVLLTSREYTHFTILNDHSSQTASLLATRQGHQVYVRIIKDSLKPNKETVQAVQIAHQHLHAQSSMLICRSSVSARLKKYGKQCGVVIIDMHTLHSWIQTFSSEAVL